MKISALVLVALVLLAACGGPKGLVSPPEAMGLLKVTITGIGEGASPTAQAEWVQIGLKGQAITVVPVNGTSALNDVQLIRRNVGFLDNDVAGTRNVFATFDLINRTTTAFNNFTLYAVNVPSNIGGTGIALMTAGTGAAITDPAIARSLKPTHGMHASSQALEVHPTIADLQLFTPSETTDVKNQAVLSGILTSSSTVLEYGFVARNYTGGRAISARNSGTDCTILACKGSVTLAYQFPKLSPRQNNPFAFSLYFVVANESVQMGSQSIEEQIPNTVMGLTNPAGFSQIRTLAGSYFDKSNEALYPICRVKTAISPNLFLGPDPIPNDPGSWDVCFGFFGKKLTAIGSGNDFANSIAVQADGKIVVAGSSQSGSQYDFALARYNPNGSLDTSFDGDGKVTTDIGSTDQAYAVAIQADGKIVVAGYTLNFFALVRYNTNGSLDTSFDGDGIVYTLIGSGARGRSIAIQADGKIVVGGYSNNGSDNDFALVRYNTNGSLDTSFDGDGKVTTAIGSSDDFANSLAIQSDGKIVLAGYAGSNPYFALARYNPNGSLDTTFGAAGKVITAVGPSNDRANSLAIQADGKIVVAGFSFTGSNDDFALVRYNSNGSLDNSFDGDGKVTTALGSGTDQANSVAIQADGKIVLAGVILSSVGFPADFGMARYNSNGSLDTGFNSDGTVFISVASGDDVANSIAIQADGKIVLAGGGVSSNTDFALARYNP